MHGKASQFVTIREWVNGQGRGARRLNQTKSPLPPAKSNVTEGRRLLTFGSRAPGRNFAIAGIIYVSIPTSAVPAISADAMDEQQVFG